jgi:hypothetical protein
VAVRFLETGRKVHKPLYLSLLSRKVIDKEFVQTPFTRAPELDVLIWNGLG